MSFLNSRIPSYMVPSAFVMLDRVPLTPNGKVDFRALPPPGTDAVHGKTNGSRPPGTAAEKALAGIWCEVLNLKSVGVDENFFELGGHSLLATRIVSRVPNTWIIEMPFASIFEHPTIGGMASVLEHILAADPGEIAGGREGSPGGHASGPTT